jgi:flagellin
VQITQNLQAFDAYLSLTKNSAQVASSLQKLSSGYRINKAADDASGLVISQNLGAEVGGLQQATRNAQDGISVVQTADGALSEVGTMLQRMSDLAVQSANTGSSDSTARAAAQAEVTQLTAEIDQIAGSTRFGAQNLLDGSFGSTPAQLTGYNSTATKTLSAASTFTLTAGGGNVTVNLAAGTYTGSQLASTTQTAIKAALLGGSTAQQAIADDFKVTSTTVGNGFALNIAGTLAAAATFTTADGTNTPLAGLSLVGTSTAAAGTGAVFQVGSNAGDTINVSIASVSTAGLGINSLDLVNNASAAITSLASAIASVSSTRGNLGAIQNRFQSTIDNLGVAVENLSASQSAIQDTDMASEMSNFTSHQVLVQAGTAMLAQANQLPSLVLKLLQ